MRYLGSSSAEPSGRRQRPGAQAHALPTEGLARPLVTNLEAQHPRSTPGLLDPVMGEHEAPEGSVCAHTVLRRKQF